MSTTMAQITVTRAGEIVYKWIPEAVPTELEPYPWPKPIAAKLTAADAAYLAIDAARMNHEDAEAGVGAAGEADKALLIAALRAGKEDPGTPASDAAARAEVVAWTALEIAFADANAPMQAASDAVVDFLAQHSDEIAVYELLKWDDAIEAQRLAREAVATAEHARRAVGSVYVHSRWFTGEIFQPEPFILNDAADGQGAYIVETRRRYEAMRDAGSNT